MEDTQYRTDYMRFIYATAWKIPEISTVIGTFYDFILPLFCETIQHLTVLDLAWSYLDFISLIIVGITQVIDDKTHRPTQSKITGIMNIVSGLQLLLIFSLLSPALPIAFAAVAWNDLLLSLEPLRHAWKCCNDLKYWQDDMKVRIKKTKISDAIESKRLNEVLIKSNASRDPTVMAELIEVYNEKLQETLIFTFSALGWSLLLFPIPGVQAIGIAMLIVAAGMYACKNGDFLYNQMISIYNMIGSSAASCIQSPDNISVDDAQHTPR